MAKVKIEGYQLRVNNSTDEQKVYDISCSIHVSGDAVNSIDNGNVMKDGEYVADFSRYEANSLNVTYRNLSASEQCNVNNAINEFIENATTSAEAVQVNYSSQE